MAKQEWLQVRMTVEEKEELHEMAERLDLGMSEVVRVALQFLLDNPKIATALSNGEQP